MKPPRKVAIRRAPADVTATDRQGKGIGDIEAMRQMATKSIPEILSMTPGIGEAMSLYDAQKAASEGDALGTGLGLAGAIPIAGTLGRGAGKLAKPIVERIPTLYHGTASAPFTKFLREKMGAGLNRLGVGGYGTEAIREGLDYIKNRLPTGRSEIVTNKGNTLDVPIETATILRSGDMSLEESIASQQRVIDYYQNLGKRIGVSRPSPRSLGKIEDAKALLYDLLTARDEGIAEIRRPGSLLELGIDADPTKLLNYDKDMIDQTPFVQDALMDALGLKGPVNPRNKDQMFGFNNLLNSKLRTREGSKALEDAGIQGVVGASNMTPETKNYAIFDPDRISVLRNLGLLGMLTGGASMYNQPSEQPLAPSNRMR